MSIRDCSRPTLRAPKGEQPEPRAIWCNEGDLGHGDLRICCKAHALRGRCPWTLGRMLGLARRERQVVDVAFQPRRSAACPDCTAHCPQTRGRVVSVCGANSEVRMAVNQVHGPGIELPGAQAVLD